MRERKFFNPIVLKEWNPLFKAMSEHDRSELLIAIASFPDYDPEGVSLWAFFKDQLDKQKDAYEAKCNRNKEIAHEREQRNQALASQNTNVNERTRPCTNVNERERDGTNVHLNNNNNNNNNNNTTTVSSSSRALDAQQAKQIPPKKPVTHKFNIETLPEDWRRACEEMRPDLNADQTFAAFKFYWTKGKGMTKMRNDAGWATSWTNWVRDEKEPRNVKPQEPERFSEEYYASSINPDGSPNWGI